MNNTSLINFFILKKTNMKAIKIFTILLLTLSFSTFSQDKFKEKKEQIKALKVAFITDELNLTSDEASKFWPIYNAFDDKQSELKYEKMRSYKKRLENDEASKITEKEATTLLAQMESTDDELYQLRKKYNANLKGVLSPIKIVQLKSAEEKFNRKLLKQYRDKVHK